MKHRQTGFTMIELIVVIVILGILAATALPKFVDIKSDAQLASLNGMVGTASSAMSLNYAGCSATGHVVTANKCVKVDNCDDLASLLTNGAMPTGFTPTAHALSSGAGDNGTTFDCVLTLSGYATTKTFVGIGAGN